MEQIFERVRKGRCDKLTRFEEFNNMSLDELAEWIDKNGTWDDSPWNKWWDEKYCNQCESVIGTVCDIFGRKCECAWCEVEHKCRYFPDMDDVPSCKDIIKMWLESEVEVKNETSSKNF